MRKRYTLSLFDRSELMINLTTWADDSTEAIAWAEMEAAAYNASAFSLYCGETIVKQEGF